MKTNTKCPNCLLVWNASIDKIIKHNHICQNCRGFDVEEKLKNIVDIRLKMYSDKQYGKGELRKILNQM